MIFNVLYNPNIQDDMSVSMALAEDLVAKDFEYTTNADGTFTITNWKGTTSGVSNGTEVIIPNLALVVW